MKKPDNERYVLTWVKDQAGLKYWEIDSYSKNIGWFKATAWEHKVLYWEELPPKPEDV